jgi:hypothetical protein
MDAWSRNALRGAAFGFGSYAVLYPLAVWLGPKLSPSCASLDKRGQLEWAAYIPSTVNAAMIVIAASRHVLNSSVSDARADLLPLVSQRQRRHR